MLKRSKFKMGYTHLTTCEMGKLIPFFWQACLPSDIAVLSAKSIHKAQPMIAPLMHEIKITMQYFFVPNRILWDNWTEFITGGESGTAAPVMPYIKETTGIQKNTLADYFGLPLGKPNIKYSALLHRAYAKIWNDHFKIDDIETEKPISTADGLDTTTNRELLNCHWKRDRFTRAKPFTQRGAQAIVPIQPALVDNYAYPITLKTITQNGNSSATLPKDANLAGSIYYKKSDIPNSQTFVFTEKNIISFEMNSIAENNNYIHIYTDKGQPASFEYYIPVNIQQGEIQSYSENQYTNAKSNSVTINFGENSNTTNFTAQLESTSQNKISTGKIGSLNVLDLRTSSAYQRFQEKSLKYGANYEDYCKMEFGARPRDARLNKAEYIGGSQSILQISEIFQTTDSTSTPLGAQAGYGVGSLKPRRMRFYAPEHGFIIGLISYRPATIYMDGIDRELLKDNRFDYFTREFANIGAQEILEQEIYADENNEGKIFGYSLNGNYQEYRRRQNIVTGSFRDDLAFWHMARHFDQAPVLNSSFLEMNPTKDIFAITDETLPAFLTYIQNDNIMYRRIPRKSRNILQ